MTLKFAVAVFVKTPGLSPIKTRLAKDIGEFEALEVYKKCVSSIQAKVSRIAKNSSYSLVPYWAVAEEEGSAHPLWQSWSRVFQGQGDLGERLHKVYSELLIDFDGVVLMGADSPLFPEEEVKKSISWLAQNENGVFVGPTVDGGYYVLGSRRSIAKSIWTSVAYSTNHTLEDFLKLLPNDFEKNFLAQHWDVDTVEDLKRLKDEAPEFFKGETKWM